jgi:hypothetical protein
MADFSDLAYTVRRLGAGKKYANKLNFFRVQLSPRDQGGVFLAGLGGGGGCLLERSPELREGCRLRYPIQRLR